MNLLTTVFAIVASPNDSLLFCDDLNCLGADSSSIDDGLSGVIDSFGRLETTMSSTFSSQTHVKPSLISQWQSRVHLRPSGVRAAKTGFSETSTSNRWSDLLQHPKNRYTIDRARTEAVLIFVACRYCRWVCWPDDRQIVRTRQGGVIEEVHPPTDEADQNVVVTRCNRHKERTPPTKRRMTAWSETTYRRCCRAASEFIDNSCRDSNGGLTDVTTPWSGGK